MPDLVNLRLKDATKVKVAEITISFSPTDYIRNSKINLGFFFNNIALVYYT